jgi:hypothetical protein
MGLGPNFKERKRHQKRGDVLFSAFPASAEDLPMGHILPRVLTAMLRSLVPRPASFLEFQGRLGGSGSC